jgi:septal ring factor EnvC (AmiA/AmiB activator)
MVDVAIGKIVELSPVFGLMILGMRYLLSQLKETKDDLKATQAEVQKLQEERKEESKILFTLVYEVKAVVAAFVDESKDLKRVINHYIYEQKK